MGRKTEREKEFKLLYEMGIKKEEEIEFLQPYLMREGLMEGYVKDVLTLYFSHRDDIMDKIQKSSKRWDVSRMIKLDLTVLKLAVTEMVYCDDIPVAVAINEAVSLSKKYSGEDSYKFINGILKQITIDQKEEKVELSNDSNA